MGGWQLLSNWQAQPTQSLYEGRRVIWQVVSSLFCAQPHVQPKKSTTGVASEWGYHFRVTKYIIIVCIYMYVFPSNRYVGSRGRSSYFSLGVVAAEKCLWRDNMNSIINRRVVSAHTDQCGSRRRRWLQFSELSWLVLWLPRKQYN